MIFVPSGGNEFATGSGIVTVADGKLTLDYLGGGQNTKLNYVSIQPYSPPTFAEPTYAFSVSVDAVEGDPVGTAAATDPEGGAISYQLSGTGLKILL